MYSLIIKNSILHVIFHLFARVSMLEIKTYESGDCSCGVFSSDSDYPILEQTFQFKLPCNEDGTNKCTQICTLLVQAAQEKALEIICDKLENNHFDELDIILNTRICNHQWKPLGLTIPPVCCHNGKSIAGNFQE